jgi:hypothetical protein
VGAFWQFFLLAAVLGAIGYGVYRLGIGYDRKRLDRARHRQHLQARADYEHHLWMHGDPRGFYGQYPPAV